MSNQYYNDQSRELAQQYLSKTFDEVHSSWAHLLPSIFENPDARILDVGAGVGRDVKHLSALSDHAHGDENNVQIVAVEPASEMRKIGRETTQGSSIKWINDSLPALNEVSKIELSFDLILLSAVWMHVPQSDRARAIRKLSNMLKPGGQIVISLRYGQTKNDFTERKMYEVSAEELKKLACNVGLFCKMESSIETDKLGRSHVSWQTLVLQLPDGGTGAFPFIRHVAINDGKSATHKLALLRVLLRIADGHAGAVLRREPGINGDRVILPVGLIALYWCHQYKGLIDQQGLFQSPNKSPNMGFMKPEGWHRLTHRTSSDYQIGNLFVGDDAVALHKTLSASVRNIKEMPCRYITLPNTDESIFEIHSKSVRAKDRLFLDLDSLKQWGEFSLPESTWLTLSRYACWIEPVIISEWVKTMASYQGNAKYKEPGQHHYLYSALQWLEPKRTTTEVRNRFDELRKIEAMHCVWSAKQLKQDFDIDHSLPFARWPNNDLWNLLPTDCTVNNQKSDKLPSKHKFINARSRITEWWQQAWLSAKDHSIHRRFFAEANLALPGLTNDNQSTTDVFEAIMMQRSRLKEMQQLKEW